jgi:hypothetical protein
MMVRTPRTGPNVAFARLRIVTVVRNVGDPPLVIIPFALLGSTLGCKSHPICAKSRNWKMSQSKMIVSSTLLCGRSTAVERKLM